MLFRSVHPKGRGGRSRWGDMAQTGCTGLVSEDLPPGENMGLHFPGCSSELPASLRPMIAGAGRRVASRSRESALPGGNRRASWRLSADHDASPCRHAPPTGPVWDHGQQYNKPVARVGSDLCRPSRFTRQPGRLWELSFNSQNPGPCLGQEAWLWTIG